MLLLDKPRRLSTDIDIIVDSGNRLRLQSLSIRTQKIFYENKRDKK